MRGQGPTKTTGRIVTTFPWTVGMKHGSTTKGTSTSRRTRSGYQKLFSQFYQVHLDRMIRKNELLWGDFCKPKYHWNEVKEEYEKYLDLKHDRLWPHRSKYGCDTNSKDSHSWTWKSISHSQQLWWWWQMNFSKENLKGSFATMSHMLIKKLVNFVESRKQMTIESYKFFIEHAYNQFVTHSAFQNFCKIQDEGQGYHRSWYYTCQHQTFWLCVDWFASKSLFSFQKIKLVMFTMDDVAEDDTDRWADVLPRLEGKIEREDEQEPQQVQDVQGEVQEETHGRCKPSVSSPLGEETQEEPGDSGQAERLEFPPGNFSSRTLWQLHHVHSFLFRNSINLENGCLTWVSELFRTRTPRITPSFDTWWR